MALTTSRTESYWPARLAIISVAALQLVLNDRFTVGPNWLIPALELLLLLPLSIVRHQQSTALRQTARIPGVAAVARYGGVRLFSFVMVGVLNLANLASLILLVQSLLHGSKASGKMLLVDALNIWFTNIIIYALWYWELDRGGPARREDGTERDPDLLFPQMSMPTDSPYRSSTPWHPAFIDYLFLSFTNATAFSPTDTLPLTPNAKLLMMIQSGISLLTVALVASRAVNILS